MSKVYLEPAHSINVYAECDILVVGGGSAGHSAALAAARAGAKNIIIMERYGYMGGDVTGGCVIMVPALTWYEKSFVRGIQKNGLRDGPHPERRPRAEKSPRPAPRTRSSLRRGRASTAASSSGRTRPSSAPCISSRTS